MNEHAVGFVVLVESDSKVVCEIKAMSVCHLRGLYEEIGDYIRRTEIQFAETPMDTDDPTACDTDDDEATP
jgi:hypothetical protein